MESSRQGGFYPHFIPIAQMGLLRFGVKAGGRALQVGCVLSPCRLCHDHLWTDEETEARSHIWRAAPLALNPGLPGCPFILTTALLAFPAAEAGQWGLVPLEDGSPLEEGEPCIPPGPGSAWMSPPRQPVICIAQGMMCIRPPSPSSPSYLAFSLVSPASLWRPGAWESRAWLACSLRYPRAHAWHRAGCRPSHPVSRWPRAEGGPRRAP